MLGVKKSTNLIGLYRETWRVPMQIIRKIHMFRYWNMILLSNENSIVKQIYLMLKDDANRNLTYRNQNWAHQIKSMLKIFGLSNIWQYQDQYDINLIQIKQRLFDQYHQSWYNALKCSQGLISYSRYKHTFYLEPYLDNIHERKFQTALTRFRLSSHNLEIERGRYQNIPREERFCKFCTSNVIENEYHFLLVCPLYRSLRRKYLKHYYCRWPTVNKFDNIMSTSNKNEILNLSKYIYFANKLRIESL